MFQGAEEQSLGRVQAYWVQSCSDAGFDLRVSGVRDSCGGLVSVVVLFFHSPSSWSHLQVFTPSPLDLSPCEPRFPHITRGLLFLFLMGHGPCNNTATCYQTTVSPAAPGMAQSVVLALKVMDSVPDNRSSVKC